MSVSIFFFFFTRRDLYLEACLAATDDRRSLGRSKEKKGRKFHRVASRHLFLRSRKWIDSSNEFRNDDIIVHFYRGYVLLYRSYTVGLYGRDLSHQVKGDRFHVRGIVQLDIGVYRDGVVLERGRCRRDRTCFLLLRVDLRVERDFRDLPFGRDKRENVHRDTEGIRHVRNRGIKGKKKIYIYI